MINEAKERERQMIQCNLTENVNDCDGKTLKELVEKYGENSVIYIVNGYYSEYGVDLSIRGEALETDAQYEERMKKLEKRLEAQRKRIARANTPEEVLKKEKREKEKKERILANIRNREIEIAILEKKYGL